MFDSKEDLRLLPKAFRQTLVEREDLGARWRFDGLRRGGKINSCSFELYRLPLIILRRISASVSILPGSRLMLPPRIRRIACSCSRRRPYFTEAISPAYVGGQILNS